MPTNTYVALQTQTVSSPTASVILSSIPSGYTDLVLVCNLGGSASDVVSWLRFNGDSGTNYSNTKILGNGSITQSQRDSNITIAKITDNVTANTLTMNTIVNIQNYSNTTTFKTALVRFNNPGGVVEAIVNLWRSTTSINQIEIGTSGANFLTGSTFSLYGIAATATGTGTAKATGGTITYDSFGYVYHTFTSTGIFTPNQTLTCDYVVVAGGGGGGSDNAGGGGGGGLRSSMFPTGGNGSPETPLTLNATGYTVQVGGGGAYGPTENRGSNGVNSIFATVTSNGGGGAGSGSATGSWNSGSNGGSGGGARGNRTDTTSGTGTANQGFNAGTTGSGTGSTGGGGAGAASRNAFTAAATPGGAGVTVYMSGAYTTYGGGGGASWNGISAAGGAGGGGAGGTGTGGGANGGTNTGGGGGGGGDAGGVGAPGGSGIVIVRYYGL